MKYKCPNCLSVFDKCDIKCRCGRVILETDKINNLNIIKEVNKNGRTNN